MKKSSAKNLIVKDNRLIEASYRLDVSEQRLILLAIVAAREAGVTLTADKWLRVSAAHYAQTCGLDSTTAYRQLKTAADSLFSRWVQMRGLDEETGKEGVIKTRWVSACAYVDQGALVRLQLAPLIIPYVTNLEACFTSYQIKNVVQMSSRYAIRLYELLAQYKTIGSRYIKIDDLRDFLDANEKSYDRLQNFKTKVLNIGLDQINKYTDLAVTCEPEKLGRSVIGYHFAIDQKPQEQPKQTAKRPKKPATSPAPPLPESLSNSERSMLRQLNERRAATDQLTDRQVFDMCRAQSTEPFLLLNTLLNA